MHRLSESLDIALAAVEKLGVELAVTARVVGVAEVVGDLLGEGSASCSRPGLKFHER